ncbi:hypothetical protein [Nocardia otitidiscaviarum]|uniref:hypothetical protein n=1 Tax=Nocardia otitidiscaviarum TaxID=1823 RepID=UPI0004A70649|nr:hypothetical protein [Nocardia otitidiscaviarum]
MEPPAGTTDFQTDAVFAPRRDTEFGATPGLTPRDGVEELATIEDLEAELARRKAGLPARRNADPEVIDSDGTPVDPPWPHDVVEIQGKQVEVKQPSAAMIRYLGVFAFGEQGVQNGDFQTFMTRHVSPKSIRDIRDWTYNDEIDEKFYDQLMKKLTTLGTARPTGPSSASQRSR